MKKSVQFLIFITLSALMSGSCTKEQTQGKTGERIHFSAWSSSIMTKTAYGSIVESGEQAINWIAGDKIKVAGENCPSTGEYSDVATYKVTEVTSGKENYGKIDVDGSGVGLVWGSPGTFHNFYAVYPETAEVTTAGIINGSIPAVQGFVGTPAAGTTSKGENAIIVQPDMDNLFMVAGTRNVESGAKIKIGDEEIFLNFLPLSTALEFTIENGFEADADMIVKSVALQRNSSSATATNILNGGFTVDMTKTGVNDRPKTTFTGTDDPSRGEVSIDFGSSPVTVAQGEKLNFTFFLNPGNAQDVEDLYFKVTFVDNNDNTKTVTRKALMKKSDGTKVSFSTHKKTRIVGLVVPESIIIKIDGAIIVTPWEDEEEIEIKPL